MGVLGVLGLWPVVTPAFGGEDPVLGQDWHHQVITWRAAREAGWSTAGVSADADVGSAAASLAWHADYVDSYLYNPVWWAAGGLDRFKVALFHHDELVKLHFDDLNSSRQILLAWDRYLAGTVAGVLWAAGRDDVSAARNITGAGLHALLSGRSLPRTPTSSPGAAPDGIWPAKAGCAMGPNTHRLARSST